MRKRRSFPMDFARPRSFVFVAGWLLATATASAQLADVGYVNVSGS